MASILLKAVSESLFSFLPISVEMFAYYIALFPVSPTFKIWYEIILSIKIPHAVVSNGVDRRV